MYIISLEPYMKGKQKVISETGYLFWLYDSEIKRYNIQEGADISEDTINNLIKSIILPRAKQKVIGMLKNSNHTEHELLTRLSMNGYTEDIAVQAVGYAKSYGYVNDMQYVLTYLRYNCKSKSKKAMTNALASKGISSELVAYAYEELYKEEGYSQNPEECAIDKEISKSLKGASISDLDDICLNKLMAKLFRKGFSYEMIRRKLKR